MRKRISRALITAAAAGAAVTTLGFAATGTAFAGTPKSFNPSGGTPIATDANCTLTSPTVPDDNCGHIGYMASGRNFRFAQALITVPDHAGVATADPELFVGLDNSGSETWQYTRVGVAPCPVSGTAILVPGQTSATTCSTTAGQSWVAFAATADNGSSPTISTHFLSGALGGDGILVNAYLTPTGNSVITTITLPDGTTFNNNFAVAGPVYNDAQAAADYTTTRVNGGAAPQPTNPSPEPKQRTAQFFQGRFTTASGQMGTFRGPWTLNALEATSNGTLPPTGTLIGQPSYLWTDGNSFKGESGDAFGAWVFPF